MSLKLMGKKKGMTRVFDDKGNLIVCTVIVAEPNVVVQVKDQEKDGYSAVQLGAVKVPESKKKNISKTTQPWMHMQQPAVASRTLPVGAPRPTGMPSTGNSTGHRSRAPE